jgi:hypothetical protein
MTRTPSEVQNPPDEPGIALGVVLIAVLVVLMIVPWVMDVKSGPITPGIGTTLSGLYGIAWGTMFLLSYYFNHKTFFFRALIWVCENWSQPKSRKMAFFYAALGIGLGSMAVLGGLGWLNLSP